MALICGDLHGNHEKLKKFLAYKPSEEHVLVGDYVDDFYHSTEDQVRTLRIALASDAVLLWGNHDLGYLRPPPTWCTGYQKDAEEIHDIINSCYHRFKAAHAVENVLITHAGVHERVLPAYGCDTAEAAAQFINGEMVMWFSHGEARKTSIFFCSGARGGEDPFSGPFWFDHRFDSPLAPFYQVFGHTKGPCPMVTDDFTCIDTHWNMCFNTDTNEVEEF